MKAALVLFTILARVMWGQAALSHPRIGFVQDNSHAVRHVFGVAGSFSLGDSIGGEALSSAFSGSFGLVKTDSAILVFDPDGQVTSRIAASPGPALFAFADQGKSALIYAATERALLRWSAQVLSDISLDAEAIGGDVVSMAQPSVSSASLLIHRADGDWLVRLAIPSGQIETQRAIPTVGRPALLLNDGGIVFSDHEGVTLRRADSSEIHFVISLSNGGRMQRMGAGWMQIVNSEGRQFAIRLQPGREQLYELPEARP